MTICSSIHASEINVHDDIQYELINWSNPQLHQQLLRQFHALCCLEFNECEMEKLSVWENLVQSQDPTWPYRMTLTIAYCPIDENNLSILGGVDHEYYPRSNCGMYPYVIVAKGARGLGLCSKLVSKGYEALNRMAQSPPYNQQNGIHELFIELSQRSDAKDDGNPYHSEKAAITRHKIWERVGFLGLEITFHHPGYLRNTAHQLTVYRPPQNYAGDRRQKPVAVNVIDCFFRDVFRGISMQENQQEDLYDPEVDKIMAQFEQGKELIVISEWR